MTKSYNTDLPEYISSSLASRILDLAPGTLANWRSKGLGPKYIKHRHRVYYVRAELERYMAENFLSFSSTAEWKTEMNKRS